MWEVAFLLNIRYNINYRNKNTKKFSDNYKLNAKSNINIKNYKILYFSKNHVF